MKMELGYMLSSQDVATDQESRALVKRMMDCRTAVGGGNRDVEVQIGYREFLHKDFVI
jgi:hypothetical protein